MGGWMTYQRLRSRNGLTFRKPDDDPDPYWRGIEPKALQSNKRLLVGDLNRMERDYLNPVYPDPPWAGRAGRSDPSTQVADATGVDVETVRRVLEYVFLKQV